MATKKIILVRHGQYVPASDKNSEKLTALGRRQARFAAKRLKEYKIHRIVHSTMPRAVETATILRNELRFKKRSMSCEQLRECVPGFPPALRKKHGHTDVKKLKRHQAQAERAFRKYFKPSSRDSVEMLVCHGNMIRYLICRALGVDTLTWRKFDIQQCGISIVEVRSKGKDGLVVLSHNEVGHIPKDLRTFL